MRKNHKRAAVAATVAAAVMLAAGCGTSADEGQAGGSGQAAEGSQSADGAEASGEQVTITYYYDASYADSTKKVVEDFEKANPNIKIQLVDLPAESNKKLQTVSTIMQAQDPSLDVFEMDCTWPLTFISAGWVEPVDDIYTDEEKAAFFQGPIEANTYDGTLYSAPLYMDAGVLLYRKDMLDKYGYEPPKTWDDQAEISKDIMSKEETITSGYSSGWKQYEALTCSALEFIWGYGGDVIDEEGNLVINSPETIQGLQRMHDLTYVDKITDPGINGYKWSESRAPFYSGNVLFIRDWPTAMAGANDPETSSIAGNVALAPIPGGTDGDNNYNTLGGWSVGISAFSEHKEEAKTFVKYLTSVEAQKTRAIYKGLMPVSPEVYDDADVLEAQPQFAQLKEIGEKSKSRPKTPYYSELSSVLQQGFASILADSQTPEEAIAEMEPQLEEILSR